MGVVDRLKHSWNAFLDQADSSSVNSRDNFMEGNAVYGTRPDRTRLRISNERSIIASIYTRLSIDVASVSLQHVRLDSNKRYIGDMDSGLNECLTLGANIDQSARAFRQDVALTLFDKGVIALVPVDTSVSPEMSGGYNIETLRVGTIVKWFPRHVKINIYNDRTGKHEDITLSKNSVAIIENPLYMVMNETNSTLQRLMRKLSMLDAVDEQSASGKLDLIIQLPYAIRSETKREQADQRRKDIEFQLKGSKYGIAYTDGTEKVTQLNRPAENNLLKQVEYLHEMLYAELGLTPEVMNGTADEAAMLNYMNRTIEPVVDAIVLEMKRKFLTKTARTQNQSIEYFRDPFKLVPLANIAEIADKFTRNEILSSNEIRAVLGFKPSSDPKAEQLVNSNMPQGDTGVSVPGTAPAASTAETDAVVDDAFDSLDAELGNILSDLGAE